MTSKVVTKADVEAKVRGVGFGNYGGRFVCHMEMVNGFVFVGYCPDAAGMPDLGKDAAYQDAMRQALVCEQYLLRDRLSGENT